MFLLKIFYSANSGSSWDSIIPPDVGDIENKDIKQILIFNENCFALVCGDYLYRTFDRGDSWEKFAEFSLETPVCYATKTSLNRLFIFEYNGSFSIPNKLFSANYFSSEKFVANTFSANATGFLKFGTNEDVVSFCDDQNKIHSYNILTEEFNTIETGLNQFQKIKDVVKYDNLNKVFLVATENGLLISIAETSSSLEYFFHEETYFSIRQVGNFIVAAGNKTISSNYGGKWSEVVNSNATKLTQQFFTLEEKTANTFYISGENGLFYECKIHI